MKTFSSPVIYILVFKTDIRFYQDLPAIEKVMSGFSEIYNWNVDRHDPENILRIESNNNISDKLIHAMQQAGFICAELED